MKKQYKHISELNNTLLEMEIKQHILENDMRYTVRAIRKSASPRNILTTTLSKLNPLQWMRRRKGY